MPQDSARPHLSRPVVPRLTFATASGFPFISILLLLVTSGIPLLSTLPISIRVLANLLAASLPFAAMQGIQRPEWQQLGSALTAILPEEAAFFSLCAGYVAGLWTTVWTMDGGANPKTLVFSASFVVGTYQLALVTWGFARVLHFRESAEGRRSPGAEAYEYVTYESE